ncbi:ras-related protein rab-5c [Anaeramoeba flamelloides]|uniref:Ras-related protein rab-5c n=1 Tax=Anaeramoeba flamelloides TaxID=1746091 RepID=A0AAV7ZK87_9EUKA|nr:ras-related protein rab-5c [Anaeramoeba flamelloides]KAJ6250120.1 ras-related protein rab-5c [Anaeramoeba flamelloides]
MTFLNSTDVQHKIVLLGDSSVGKSSVLLRFSKNEFLEEQEPTVGAAFVNHSVNIGTEIKQLQIWDTAGQERFQSLAPMYYRGAKGAIVCYDVTRFDTFDRAKDWVIELKEQGPQNVKIVLCGNKVDLNQQNVKTMEAKQYAEDNGLLFYESSAKTGKGIVEMFVGLSKNLPEDLGQTVFKDDFYDDEQLPTIILDDQKPSKKKCC